MSAQPACRTRPGQSPVVATLGDELESTCSIKLADQWLEKQGEIAGYLSFEEAVAAVAAGEADFVLLPGAYPMASRHHLRRTSRAG